MISSFLKQENDQFDMELNTSLDVNQVAIPTTLPPSSASDFSEQSFQTVPPSIPLNRDTFQGKHIRDWNVEDVCEWLKSKGISDVVDIFEREKIDGLSLLEFTDVDLEKFGIVYGRRKAILRARDELMTGDTERLVSFAYQHSLAPVPPSVASFTTTTTTVTSSSTPVTLPPNHTPQ
jgi:hypothetical protein